MRKIYLVSLALAFGCDDKPTAVTGPSDCPSGQVKINDTCLPLCKKQEDCGVDEVCVDDVCLGKQQAGWPVITAVDGDSTRTDTGDNHAGHRFTEALVITGHNLQEAGVDLVSTREGGPTFEALGLRERSASQLVVLMPPLVLVGEYLLRVVNELGRDEQTVTILRGDDGDNGAPGVCSNDQCAAAVATQGAGVAGADKVTAVTVRAVNGGGEREVVIGEGASFDPQAEDGIFILAIARATHVASDNGDEQRNYPITGAGSDPSLTALLTTLGRIDDSKFVVLVSRGDVSSRLRLGNDGLPTPLMTALTEFGASERLSRIRAGDALVFVGIRGMGAGNAVQLVAPGSAAARVLLVDRDIVGPRTATRYTGTDFVVTKQPSCPQGKSVIGVTAEGLWICDIAKVAPDGGLLVGGDTESG